MESKEITTITVEATIHAHLEVVWNSWTQAKHILNWNAATDDWHTVRAENDLRPGGKFRYRMEAKDGRMGFDFEGVYNEIDLHQLISYTIADGRTVNVVFKSTGNTTLVTETFEAENTNPPELQKAGWQAILNHFKKYVESF